MEQRTATIPFDLETAKKINIGEIAGRIVTEKGQNRAEIVYEDNSSNCPLLVVIHSISVSADWFSATGKALSSANRLLLEENNKMLKEILSFVRKVDSAEYRDHQDFMEFLRNVAADIWVEYTEPEQRGRLFNLMNKRNENSF